MYKPRDSPPIYDTTAETAARVILPPAAAALFFHARKETFSTNRGAGRLKGGRGRRRENKSSSHAQLRQEKTRQETTHIPQTDAHTTNRNQQKTIAKRCAPSFSRPSFPPSLRPLGPPNAQHQPRSPRPQHHFSPPPATTTTAHPRNPFHPYVWIRKQRNMTCTNSNTKMLRRARSIFCTLPPWKKYRLFHNHIVLIAGLPSPPLHIPFNPTIWERNTSIL